MIKKIQILNVLNVILIVKHVKILLKLVSNVLTIQDPTLLNVIVVMAFILIYLMEIVFNVNLTVNVPYFQLVLNV